MKRIGIFILSLILSAGIFCFASCGENNSTGSVPNGTGTGSGSVSEKPSNDTVNSNKGNADGGTADNNRNGGIIDGAAEDILDGTEKIADDIGNGIQNGIDNMTGTNSTAGNMTGNKSATAGNAAAVNN